MRWLRPATAHVAEDASLDAVARLLEAAAFEAPPSPRADVIRARLLAAAASDDAACMSTVRLPLLQPISLVAGIVLLIVALAVGTPAIGSLIDGLIDDRTLPPAPAPSDADADADARTDATKVLGWIGRGSTPGVARWPAAGTALDSWADGRSAPPSAVGGTPNPSPSPAPMDLGLPIGPPLPVPWPPALIQPVEPILQTPTPTPTPTAMP